MKKILLSLALASLLAACGSQEVKKDVPVADRTTGTQKPAQTGATSTTTPTQQPAIAANPLKDPANILSKRSVYFDFDSNAVKDEFRPVVQAHSKYMVDKKGAESRIETVSFGEEKPANAGHDEAAWTQNRRADIKYAGE